MFQWERRGLEEEEEEEDDDDDDVRKVQFQIWLFYLKQKWAYNSSKTGRGHRKNFSN
jgi:hypothetical protein